MGPRGIVVSYESIRELGLRFGRIFANILKRRRPQPGDMEEVFLRIRGKQHFGARSTPPRPPITQSAGDRLFSLIPDAASIAAIA